MSDDRVRTQKRIFREARLAERGDYDVDRGDYDVDRGDYDVDRGDYDVDRGDYDVDRGGVLGRGGAAGACGVASDIFRRAAGLGGHLVVAFVAPIGASSPMSRSRVRPRASSVETEAAAARAHVAELIEQRKKARPITRPQQPPGSNDARVNTQTSAYGQPIPKKEPAS